MRLRLPVYSTAYYLKAPFVFIKKQEKIVRIPRGYSLLKTLKTAVCASDLHYYLGNKLKKKLANRLPLILLHEGIAVDMEKNIRVVPIAGNFLKSPIEYQGRENLDINLPYMGATTNGMARDYFLYPQDLLLPISPLVPDNIACLIEPLSIVLRAVKDIKIHFSDEIAIIGDGGISFLLAFILHTYSQIPKNQITIYGVHEKKMAKFSDFSKTSLINTKNANKKYDIVFEAVGGKHIQDTINLSITLTKPGGTVGVIGVSDDYPSVNINRIVNQSITIKGLTRSTITEYEFAHELLKEDYAQKKIGSFIDPNEFSVGSIDDITKAFSHAVGLKGFGRVILAWNT